MNHRSTTSPYLCSELVKIRSLRTHRPAHTVVGNLEAISAASLLVLSDVRFAPGTPISINAKHHQLQGVVSTCNGDEPLGWYLTIRLNKESRWSPRQFVPEHLLALDVLERRLEAMTG